MVPRARLVAVRPDTIDLEAHPALHSGDEYEPRLTIVQSLDRLDLCVDDVKRDLQAILPQLSDRRHSRGHGRANLPEQARELRR